ncbi:MAG: glycine--tRNA ligase subunit alpha [Candidatus Cloacimonadota bacterium]|nr:MAG: glycine--tRNA ligase subunit alpha [Candidatus Cloacimonadota bacterium]
MNYQDMILRLEKFWADYGCIIMQPYNSEVGAGTFNPATFIKVLEDKPYKTAYLEITKRPKDGRYAENPNRFQQFYQFQVILQPAPFSVIDIYLESLNFLGIKLKKYDLRFVEDDWESPTLGAWGLGWEVWIDGLEITQFTYFQQVGSLSLKLIPAEITYGLDRISMFIQKTDSVLELEWAPGVLWKDVYGENEYEFSRYNFEEANIDMYREIFAKFKIEAERLLEKGLIYPAYNYVIKCSHIFNLLDARGAISVMERRGYIAEVRRLSESVAEKIRRKQTGVNN